MPTINKKQVKQRATPTQAAAMRRKVYNSQRWRDLRMLKFTYNPLCELCQREGRVALADDIHHIRSFNDAASMSEALFLAYDYDNLMSLCKQCHKRLHDEQGRHP